LERKIGEHNVVLSYLPAGNHVGEMGIFGKSVRMNTVKAAVATETIEFEARAFKLLLDQDDHLKQRVQQDYKQRLAHLIQTQKRSKQGSMMSFLVSQGLGEATDVLLIDESLCVRCDNCEKACASTHQGTSRLDRKAGPTYANIHIPTSCRHCENPHCMKDCPPDAIRRADNGEVFIADNCIGCGNCQRYCPYGVIKMTSTAPKMGLRHWLATMLGTAAKPEAMKKATKCDMCKNLPGGAACVRACPTGAAIRISPDKLTEYVHHTSGLGLR